MAEPRPPTDDADAESSDLTLEKASGMPRDAGGSKPGQPDVDDWLDGSGFDWSGDVPTRRTSGQGATVAATRGQPPSASHAVDTTIRRRRAIGLLVLLVLLGGVIWLVVAAFGGDSDGSTVETAQTTTQQPSTSTNTPTTPVTTTPAVTTPPQAVALPAGEKLRRDSTGPIVTQLQEGLTALGFEPGPVDGDFGPITEAAVVEFQQSKGLATDGVVGVNTARELNAALADQPAEGSTG